MEIDEPSDDHLSHERPISPRAIPPPIDPEQWARKAYESSSRSSVEPDPDYQFSAPTLETLKTARSRHSMPHTRPKRPSTSKHNGMPLNILPSAPASPPTPAPSPTPFQRAPSWTFASESEDHYLRDARGYFKGLDTAERQRFLAELLNMCDSQTLSFVHGFVSPRLKKDPFDFLPDELCLRVRMFCPANCNMLISAGLVFR